MVDSGSASETLSTTTAVQISLELVPCNSVRSRQRRLTTATTALHLLKRIIDVAPFVLPRVSMFPSPRDNESFDSGFGHVVLSGKTNGVVAAHVSNYVTK